MAVIEIKAAISEGKLLPRDELFYRNQIEEFEYGEEGVKIGRWSYQYVIKKTWRSGYLAEVNQLLRETKEFLAAVDILVEVCPNLKEFEIFANLVNFVNRLTDFCLPDSKFEENDIGRLIAGYLDSLLGKPLKYVAEVELTRLVISVPQLEFGATGFDKIILRQVTAQDLELEFPAYEFSIGNVKPYIQSMGSNFAFPSAILRIECLARDDGEMAERIKQALIILRLFQAPGVDIVAHRIFAEPWITSKSSR